MTTPLLLKPGPVAVPREVLEAGAAPMLHHNAPEFQVLFKQLMRDLRPFFGNDGALLVQNSSARGAMEGSLTNLFGPGEAIAMLVNGRFGLRFADIARDLGLVVHPVSTEWTRSASEAELVETLKRHPEIRGIVGSMCETGTGVMNDLDMIGRVGREFGVITVVDAVSAAAGMPINMREQHIDVCFSGIQKCFMSPPGLALIALSERVWPAVLASRHYRHYFNWIMMRQWIEQPKIRMMGTPPESLLRSLAKAVELMHAEGLPRVYERHALLARAFGAFVEACGCRLFAENPRDRSHTVSAMVLPAGMKPADVVKRALVNDNVAIATGQNHLKETVVRMGHMGPVTPAMLLTGVKALARAMTEMGHDPKLGAAGVDACATVLAAGAPAPRVAETA